MSSASKSAASSGQSELALFGAGPIPSETQPGVSYRLERAIGRGGFAIACLAERIGPDGSYPVVLKISRPAVVASSDEMVMRVLKKEVVALGRLNERVPPTPFVVRLLDTGTTHVLDGGHPLAVPWIAIEYVHGGVEGETLTKRVRYAVQHGGIAFAPARAKKVLHQLALGIGEIHAARVIHRDLKPSNVLTCGFGENEICKISDFGIARPTGVASTFGKLTLGSPGYVAPEQIHLRDEIGPWTDVFSLAAIMYFVLGGEKYFDVSSPVDGVFAAMESKRKSLLEAKALSPELRARPDRIAQIDRVLARATAPDPKSRFDSAETFESALGPWLDLSIEGREESPHSISIQDARKDAERTPRDPSAWHWARRKAPANDSVIISVAWDGDGHCLAATARGISYWDGARFCELSPPPVHPVSSLHRVGAGRWLLASDGGRLLGYSGGEASEILRCPDPAINVTALDGNPSDMLVLLGTSAGVGPVLHAAVGRHWLKPVVVDFAAAVSGVTRLGAEAWLVTGRKRDGGGFAAVYRPLEWRLDVVADASGGALVAAASQPELGLAVAVGANELWLLNADRVERRNVDEGATLSACDVDVLGGVWLAGSSTVWFVAADRAPVRAVHRDTEAGAPFISLHADVGRVVAVSVDGAVLEANAPGQS